MLVEGRVDGDALRERHLARLAKDSWPVVVVKALGAESFTWREL